MYLFVCVCLFCWGRGGGVEGGGGKVGFNGLSVQIFYLFGYHALVLRTKENTPKVKFHACVT